MAEHNEFGKLGENTAAEYLEKIGYEIVCRNFRFGNAEIDIIANDGQILVFVEVKARKTNKFGYPEEAVSTKKIEKLMEAAETFMEQNSWNGSFRFDVLALTRDRNGFDVHHIMDAFS